MYHLSYIDIVIQTTVIVHIVISTTKRSTSDIYGEIKELILNLAL